MIFVDSNIPMYIVGKAHPNKEESRRLLEEAIRAGQKLVTDAEVFQEVLHRYHAIRRREAIQPALDVLLGVVDQVYPVDLDDVLHAKDILLEQEGISARDALHLAVMSRYGIEQILSFDEGFDGAPGVTRLSTSL